MAETLNTTPIIRVIRVLEYRGSPEWIEKTLDRSLTELKTHHGHTITEIARSEAQVGVRFYGG